MRKLLLATATSAMFAGSMALAGGLAEPVMEESVVEAATSSVSHDIIVPLLLLLLILASTGGDTLPLP
jgi:hypothetical protein